NSILFGTTGGAATDLLAQGTAGVARVEATDPNIVGTRALLGSVQFLGNPMTGDPHLGPLADNGGPTKTMALPQGSPALNAGFPAAGVLTDQRGAARDNPPDLGAFEVQHPLSPVGVPPSAGDVFAPHPNTSAVEAF